MSLSVPDVTWQNTPFQFVGFGNTSENANDEGHKLQAEIPYYDNDEMFHYAIELSATTTTNLCYGDSGGPMYRTLEDGTYVLVGVNSFVFSITDEDLPCSQGGTGAIRIDVYAQWIADEIGIEFRLYFMTQIVPMKTMYVSRKTIWNQNVECIKNIDTGDTEVPKSGCHMANDGMVVYLSPYPSILCVYEWDCTRDN